MIATAVSKAELDEAVRTGRSCAVAVSCARALTEHARSYPRLFPPALFDTGLFTSIGLVSAFGSPHAGADELIVVSRAALLVFALDHHFDLAEAGQVHDLVETCLAAADGAPPGNAAAELVTDLRTQLASRASLTHLHTLWREQLHRFLQAQLHSWGWRTEGRLPGTLPAYMAIADGCGSALVNLSHWIATADSAALAVLEHLQQAGAEVQNYLRLLNDLATATREADRDINALALGFPLEQITHAMDAHAARALELICAVDDQAPREALYLRRQLAFNTGFYQGADYWGTA
ncbi:terpene synthase family protein [Nonomuraea sp. NBC_01738]|uniref:terpene synthase family protein n=1 Tax=Nonomuraea sp. NBC_01738 TaxID=2976003 RepID=UPI002E0D6D80|nr:terpene synthase family protein [Nonomuraea sp. NBC_01738]